MSMVRIISITKPESTPLIRENFSAEDLIVYIARVSNPENQLNKKTASRLIKYLIEHKHWSPFEMVDITFEIKTSRAIATQIVRHRSFCFQEFSQRYSVVNDYEPVELRLQGDKNRQVGEELIPVTSQQHSILVNLIRETTKSAEHCYEVLLRNNVAKEVARMVLPLTTQTTLYMKGSLRSWIHYVNLRGGPETQKEHRYIAERVQETLVPLFPNVSIALGWKKEHEEIKEDY
jgi:thymidylate synthase (FAD)